MPSKHLSELRNAFHQVIQKSYVGPEKGLQDSVKLLIGQGEPLFGNSRLFRTVPGASIVGFNFYLQPGTIVAAQSNLNLVIQKRNISIVGALSSTFSIPSVTGPSFQVGRYHIEHLLSEPSHVSQSIHIQKAPMAINSSRTLFGEFSVHILTSKHKHLIGRASGSITEYINISYDSGRKAAGMSLRNKEQPKNYFPYGYFMYHVAKRSGNFSPVLPSGMRSYRITSLAYFSSGTSDVSSHSPARDEQVANSTDKCKQKFLEGRSLKLNSGSCYLPHPDKEETGGEDAHFICLGQAIGVADGVGGWADLGINAGLYAQELMSNSVNAIKDEPQGSIDPSRVLEKAYSSTKARGSSTACIIALTEQGLHAINLGDSGFMVIRDGSTVLRSPAQQHDFNFTYQLENSNNSDLPSSGEVFTVPVASGDVVIAGTDGLFDNLYNNDITAVVVHAVRAGLGPQVTAQKIAALARQRAVDKNRQTPFSSAAQEAGFRYYGGKLDDITVVVSYVTSSDNA